MSATTAKGKAKETPVASLLSGAIAGGFESFATFPLESIKTQLQFAVLETGKVRLSAHAFLLQLTWTTCSP